MIRSVKIMEKLSFSFIYNLIYVMLTKDSISKCFLLYKPDFLHNILFSLNLNQVPNDKYEL